MPLDDKNKELTVLGADINTIPCAKCKWAVNGALKFNCMKFAEKPYEVYFKSEECPKFQSKKKFEKFTKEEEEK